MRKRPYIAAILLLTALLSRETSAQQPDLTARDRAAVLYSTQLAFDRDHVPVISLSLMEGQREIRLRSKGRLRILPDGEGGPEILTEPGRTWTARLEGGKAGAARYWVVLARVPARRMDAVRAARERLKAQGLSIRSFEVGSIFGFFGQVMDNREVLLVEDRPFDDREMARTAATAAEARLGWECSIHATLEARPQGEIVLTDDRNTVTIRNHDVIWFVPETPSQTIRVSDVEFGKGFSWHGREDRRYRGRMYVAVDSQGLLTVVNVLDAESLLRGIVPAEIYPSAPPAALQAQAVVARGELLAKIGTRHLADPYLLCADVHCQAYRGVGREDRRTDDAVAATRGQMLFDEKGLVDSVYSASSGGHTEHNEYVWPGSPNPALRGVFDGPVAPEWLTGAPMTEEETRRFLTEPVDSWAARASRGREHFRWRVERDAGEISRLVAKRYEVGDVQALRVLERGVSGRARRLEILGTGGRAVVEWELPIRKLLGGLKSGLFVVDAERDARGRVARFVFTGGGFGHGVGLCQIGAMGMAEAGRDFVEILTHYYTGSSIKKVY